MTENREMLMKYLQREDLLTEEKVDLILGLITHSGYSKTDLLKMSGVDTDKMNFDTAYPEPYADKLREQYPDFSNGCHIFDYSDSSWGRMVNINNLFAKHVLKTLAIH